MKKDKKYRLIKKLPFEDSPDIGYISSPKADDAHCWNDNWFYPEDYPEFWQEVIEYPIGTKVLNSATNTIYTKKEDGWYRPSEKTSYTDEMISKFKYISVIDEKVVEKDYEILYFRKTNRTYKICNDGNLLWDIPEYKDITLNPRAIHYTEATNSGYNIHSVKRLSDDEIFTVGDIVQDSLTDDLTNFKHQKIIFFNFGDKIICNAESGTTMPLNTIRHIKQPLFTTEDGVDIFEGDITYSVSVKHLILIPESKWGTGTSYNRKIYLEFSTKESAKEYILMNKLCLSLKQIIKTYKLSDKSQWSGLEKLIKSKL